MLRGAKNLRQTGKRVCRCRLDQIGKKQGLCDPYGNQGAQTGAQAKGIGP